MRVMVIVKSSPEADAIESMPKREELAEMGKFNDELARNGILIEAHGLLSSRRGTRVRFEPGKKTVIDGPFTETKELVAGFWIWQVKSIDEAVEWLKKAPFPDAAHPEFAEVEIRQIAEPEDFDEALNSEAGERA